MLDIERDALWIDFFDQISAHLHSDFAWDLATLTSGILDRSTDASIKDACGSIGRWLLQWVWKERETSENDWYNRLGSYWAVPLVTKTYDTNEKESRTLLEKILELLQEDNFPIDFLSELTKHIEKIWEYDPKFVASVYRTVFTHDELNDEGTLRGGYISSFRTYRGQDYRMCQYMLAKHFPKFLRAVPLHATPAAIQSLNYFAISNSIVEDFEIEKFDFRGKSVLSVRDYSYMWFEHQYTAEPIKIADTLFEFIAELASSKKSLPLLDSLLDILRDHACFAFLWKRLLKAASRFPEVFASRLFELCIAKPIQMSTETSDELGPFLKVAAPEFTPEQLHQIEKSIVALPKEKGNNNTSLKGRRNWLLVHIPVHLLLTNSAKKTREEMERKKDIPENPRPIRSTFSSEPYTEEKEFQEQGVDITKSTNQESHRFFKSLRDFNSEWRNSQPTEAAIRLIFPHVEEAYATLQNNTAADKEVIDSLWLKLTDCVAILSRVAEDPEDSMFTFCRQLLLKGAEHEQPKPNPYFDSQFNSSGYSPFPRHGAARGLLRLAFLQPDAEMLDAIEKLANDPVPSVRMVTAMELTNVYAKASERFWHIMDSRAAQEPNRVVQQYLYATLTRVVEIKKENENKTTRVMAKLLEHTPLSTEDLKPSDSFIVLLMRLAIDRDNSWALKTIEDTFFQTPIQFANPLSYAVSEVMRNYVNPKHLETVEGRERTKRAIKWVNSAITVTSDEIAKLYSPSKEYWNEEETEKLRKTYAIIEKVIRCLYFAVGKKRDSSEKQVVEISWELHREFYNEVKSLMQQVIDFAQEPEDGIMLAKTAHYFMRVLTSFLSCNPKEVLHLATGVVKSSEPFGYNLDSIAVRDVVEFVEIVLADYRHEVRDDEECLKDLLNLLDMFAKTGWSDALKLVWRLDEVFR